MMKKIQKLHRLLGLIGGAVLLVLGAASCIKKEFLPPEEGQAVPFTDSTQDLRDALSGSPYTLYWAAYQRSHLDEALNALSPKIAFTLLVPDNAAFEAIGMDLAAIRRSSPEMLDSLLMFHSIAGQIDPDALALQNGNILGITLQTNSAYTEIYNPAGKSSNIYASSLARVYHYRHYLGIADGNLLVNGKKAGLANQAILVRGGTLLPIDHVLKKPGKDILQTLQEDGRFNLFVQFRAFNDAEYLSIISTLPYAYPPDPTFDQLSTTLYPNQVHFYSMLAPTDEAFHQAGINNLDDLKRLNSRAYPYPWDEYGVMSSYLTSDSILNNHFWRLNNLNVVNPKTSYGYGTVVMNTALTFYSNDLNNDLLGHYVTSFDGSYFAVYENNLDFIRDGENIQVRVKGSEAEPATIVEKDIETLNGPIHALDRLLLPPGFKLN